MCGLFGVASTHFSLKERQVFETLGLISAVRGIDSTGIAVGTKQGKKKPLAATVVKRAEASGWFFGLQSVQKVVESTSTFALGHCRASTIGEVTMENAHPYNIGHIVGAHNGTCHAYQNTGSGRTDSYHLYEHLAEEAIDDVVEKAKHGAYALTYFDEEEQTLNFLRNKDRPLWLAECPAMRTLVWASESDMIEFALRRVDMKYEKPFLLTEDNLRSYPVDDFNIKNFTTRVVRPKPVTYSSSGRFQGTQKGTVKNSTSLFGLSHDDESWEEALARMDAENAKGDSAPAVDAEIPFLPAEAERTLTNLGPTKPRDVSKNTELAKRNGLFYEIGEKAFITTHRAEELLKCGCVVCSKTKQLTDEVGWISKTDYVCSSCLYGVQFSDYRKVLYNRPWVVRGRKPKQTSEVTKAAESSTLLAKSDSQVPAGGTMSSSVLIPQIVN